ncbi:MAG: hypothetical protein ACRDTE_12310 [Pseudonocardiaceae bacterium]
MASTKVAQRRAGAKTAETAEDETAEDETAETPEGETPEAETPEGEETPRRRTATVNLPFVTAEFRAPDFHLPSLPVHAPDRNDLTGAVSAIRSRLPSPAQTAYYTGLGVLGVLELIEWPVVLAIGVGTALAQQAGSRRTESEPSGEEATAQ